MKDLNNRKSKLCLMVESNKLESFVDNERGGKASKGGGDGRCSVEFDDGDGCCLLDDTL